MGFQQNYNMGGSSDSNGGNNQQRGPEAKKKQNFKINKIYGADGIMDITVWSSDKGGCYCILSIKTSVGKDPSTGANVYEQKMASELPSGFMNIDATKALIEAMRHEKPESCNINMEAGRGSKVSVIGNGNTFTITLENQKNGKRAITFNAIPVGPTSVHASYMNIIEMLEIAYKKILRNKLDPEEFTGESESGDSPF